jgi:hypothetical protein
MDDQPTILSGRVTDVRPTHVVLGCTRIELHIKQAPAAFLLGYSVTVMAVADGEKFIGGTLA